MSGVIWGNPIAWAGLTAIAVPVIVHLLARRRASIVPFPTLRFLSDSSTASVRRRRIEDWPLLLLRCLIVAVAAAALAQPWVRSERRARSFASGVARAVVVDSSASMGRDAVDGGTAIGAARAAAAGLARESSSAITIESDSIDAGISRAAVWLRGAAGAAGLSELVVVSDFQVGALKATDFAPLPATTGVRLQQIDVARRAAIAMPPLSLGTRLWAAEATVDEERTSARWSEADNPGAAGVPDIAWLAGAAEQQGAAAAVAAAAAVVAVPIPAATTPATPRPVTIIWPGAAERPELLATSETINEPWMAEVLLALPPEAGFSAAARQDGRLLLFTDAPAEDIASASLAASVRGAVVAGATPMGELEPGVIDELALRGFERPASETSTAAGSDGRWLWLVVLALLLVEHRVRRRD